MLSIPLNFIVIEGIGNVYLSTLIIFLLFGWVLIVSNGKLVLKNNAIVAILIFLIAAVSTFINVIVFDSSLVNFQITNSVIYLQVTLVFLIVNYIFNWVSLEYFFKVFIVIALIAAIRVWIEEPNHFFELSVYWTKRIEAYFIGGVNNFALILGVALIISFFHLRNLKLKIILSIIFFVTIVLSMSRGALLGVILTLFITSLYDTNRKTFKLLIKSTLFLILSVIVFLLITDNLQVVIDKVHERFFSLFTGDQDLNVFFSGRGDLLLNMFEKMFNAPIFQLFFGHGNGGIDFFDVVNNQRYETSHNILIDVIYRNGLFLLILYMAIFIQLLLMFLKRRSKDKLALFGIFVFFHLELLVNPILFAAQVGWLYALLMVYFLKQDAINEKRNAKINVSISNN